MKYKPRVLSLSKYKPGCGYCNSVRPVISVLPQHFQSGIGNVNAVGG